jgi:hypothetical protein
VIFDSTLTRTAQEQATAIASNEKLDHSVASFNSRVASSGPGGGTENIGYS